MEKVLWLIESVKTFVKLCARDFLLDDALRSGRPVEVDNDQIETLIENNQCYVTWEIADIIKISKSINLLVKMKNVSSMEKNWTFLPTQCMLFLLLRSIINLVLTLTS